MNDTCEIIYRVLPDTAEKIQAWAALITTLIAGYALFSWRAQKQFDIDMNAKANLTNCIYIIKRVCFSRGESSKFLLQNGDIKHKLYHKTVKNTYYLEFKLAVYEFSRKKYYDELKDVLRIIRLYVFKLNRTP